MFGIIIKLGNMTKEDFLESIRLNNEEWRDVVGGGGQYFVSSYGRVCSYGGRKGNHLMTLYVRPEKNKKYAAVSILLNGKRKKVRVHRLVAEAFIPNPNGYKEIDHINGDGTDNNVSNLRWCDRSSNMQNPITLKRLRLSSHHRQEEKCLADRKIARIKNGEIIAIYNSISDIKKEGYNDCCVYWACNGKHKTHAGFEWKYIFYND